MRVNVNPNVSVERRIAGVPTEGRAGRMFVPRGSRETLTRVGLYKEGVPLWVWSFRVWGPILTQRGNEHRTRADDAVWDAVSPDLWALTVSSALFPQWCADLVIGARRLHDLEGGW